MVAAVREGHSQRSVARQFGVSLATVQLWVKRAESRLLEQVDWEDASHAPHQQLKQTPAEIEAQIVSLRGQLAKKSALGEYGAEAIRNQLLALPEMALASVPSVTTINRVLKRYGAFDSRQRVRRPPPPPGWYLPDVAARQAEIDEADFVEELAIEGGPTVFILNLISLHGALCASWPTLAMRATFVNDCLLAHWRQFGLPQYAQFDNGSVFHGRHCPDNIGSITRLCLSLNVTPVFTVPREFGIQSSIESYNNRWQQKVWQRFHVSSLEELEAHSARYVMAVRQKYRQRCEAAPARRPFPSDWNGSAHLERTRKLIFLRRTSEKGHVSLLSQDFTVCPQWPNRLVRCEVDLVTEQIRVYGLRRQEPGQQPLLREWNYRLPDKTRKRALESG